MDSAKDTPRSIHFELTIRCDSCDQRYGGKAFIETTSLVGGGGEKARMKLEQKADRAISEYKGVGVQRCPHCGHIQAWNKEETADIYANWWMLGITALVFGGSFVFTYAISGFKPDSPDLWSNLLKLVGFPLIALFLGVLIFRPVSRGYHARKYSTSGKYEPQIRIVDE